MNGIIWEELTEGKAVSFEQKKTWEKIGIPQYISKSENWMEKVQKSKNLFKKAIFFRASRDKQQNQTTITTNINYIQNFISI